MVVEKYKPKQTSRIEYTKVEAAIVRANRNVDAARATVARSKKAVETAKELVRSLRESG